MSTFTFDLESIKGSVGSFESALYSKTPDDKLTYSGNDPIIWDNVNNERIRRGLSPLPGPRPVDDGKTYNYRSGNQPTNAGTARELTPEETAKAAAIAKQFGLPDPTAVSKTFDVEGPTGMTREQAFEIFKKQADTGGLTGFAPGDTLSAETQAADGLSAALAQVGQQASGVTGALGAGIPGAAGAIGKLTAAAGAGTAIGTTAAGVTATVGQAVNSLTATGAIGLADFAKQAPALTGISNMTLPDVTSVLAQAKKTAGQTQTAISNTLGVGEFGLNAQQLESAGIVKPGTNSLVTGNNTLTDVLKSPAVFTGKNGINSLDNFLSSSSAQSTTMQNLMSNGLDKLTAAGVPVDQLTPKVTGGLALASVGAAGASMTSLLNGLPVSPDAKAKFQQDFANASAAISLADSKVPAAFKDQTVPESVTNTVNRSTVDSAVSRILGNDKIPVPRFTL